MIWSKLADGRLNEGGRIREITASEYCRYGPTGKLNGINFVERIIPVENLVDDNFTGKNMVDENLGGYQNGQVKKMGVV